jgi:putative ABC transport system permease protein
MFKLPLGWMQLKKEKLRFAVALAGVGFAVILILMQLGFRESMFASAVRYHEAFRYDIALISPETAFIVAPRPFADRRLFQALSVPGVRSVSPVYLSQGFWKNPYTFAARQIFVLGIRTADASLDIPGLAPLLDRITREDVVLYDRAGRPEFGAIAEHFDAGDPVSAELNNRRVDVGGIFDFGTSFGIDGSVLTSDVNFLRIFPNRQRGEINLGLIRIEPSADPDRVAEALRRLLPADVLVLTKAEFIARERRYWGETTPIGYVFAFGVVVGVVVGGIIVYQILFSDVSDHLAEYATLKAMGYSNSYLSGVVLQQAVILAILGYLPGLGIALLLYRTAGQATRLPLAMTLERGIAVLVLTVAMCSVSALIALRKVRSADPADVF